jgi:hypothetical protein
LNETPYGNDTNVCGAGSDIPFHDGDAPFGIRQRPQVKLIYNTDVPDVPDMTDAEGSAADIIAGDPLPSPDVEAWRYYLQNLRMKFHPCRYDLGHQYCGSDEYTNARWMCKWYTYNVGGAGWAMHCVNSIIEPGLGDEAPHSSIQNVPRDLHPVWFVFGGKRAAVFVRFRFGPGSCFHLDDTYVFTFGCLRAGGEQPFWSCVRNEQGSGERIMKSIFGIYLIAAPHINTTDIAEGGLYPHRRADDIAVKNHCWDEVRRGFVDLWDAEEPSLEHGANMYTSGTASAWWLSPYGKGLFNCDDRPPGTGARVVTTEGTTPLAISMYEPLLNMYFPAQLHINELRVDVTINVESRARTSGGFARRVFGAAWFYLTVRPWLTARAYSLAHDAGLVFMGEAAGDRYDTRIEDASRLGSEHPQLKLLATGPAYGRIPYAMEWNALLANPPYSVGSHTYKPDCVEDNPHGLPHASGACWTLQAINRCVMFGEVNNHADPTGPQLFMDQDAGGNRIGSISFVLPLFDRRNDEFYSLACHCVDDVQP